jgi:DNA (cytosine-5)-methyltransferase 1
MTQREIATRLQVSSKTIARWESREVPYPALLEPALREILQEGHRPAGPSSFSFIDLFAGIGGIRKGFEQAGGRGGFTSEWNEWAQKTYRANFHDKHELVGDIQKHHEADIPDHDVLLAGFPCQPFSIAGVSKKNATMEFWRGTA